MDKTELPIHNGVGVIIDTGKEWVLQLRDNRDGILWPGKVSLWGGAMESMDSSNFALTAFRELSEELELAPEEVELVTFGEISAPHEAISGSLKQLHLKLFVARLKEPRALHAYEGKGTFTISKTGFPDEHADTEFAPLAYEALELLQSRRP